MEVVVFIGQMLVIGLMLWPVAWIGKKITENQANDTERWQRREEHQMMKERYGGK